MPREGDNPRESGRLEYTLLRTEWTTISLRPATGHPNRFDFPGTLANHLNVELAGRDHLTPDFWCVEEKDFLVQSGHNCRRLSKPEGNANTMCFCFGRWIV